MAHGKSITLNQIPRRTIVVLHEHTAHTTPRYKEFGGVANRAARRAYARGRGRLMGMPAPTLKPYERPAVGSLRFEAEALLNARNAVPVYR